MIGKKLSKLRKHVIKFPLNSHEYSDLPMYEYTIEELMRKENTDPTLEEMRMYAAIGRGYRTVTEYTVDKTHRVRNEKGELEFLYFSRKISYVIYELKYNSKVIYNILGQSERKSK